MIIFIIGGIIIPIDMTKITKEMAAKALECKTADELMILAKAEGFKLTKEEAEAYMDEIEDVELDEKALDKVAGGGCYSDCKAEAWL